MPSTPILDRASFTSSSLKGLMIASILFMIVGSEGDTNDQSRSVNRNLKIKHDFFSICGAKTFPDSWPCHVRETHRPPHHLRIPEIGLMKPHAPSNKKLILWPGLDKNPFRWFCSRRLRNRFRASAVLDRSLTAQQISSSGSVQTGAGEPA